MSQSTIEGHGRYIGPDPFLKRKTALVRVVDGRVLAQFDDNTDSYGYGWHEFPRYDFEILRRYNND